MATATFPRARPARRASVFRRMFSADSLARAGVFLCATAILALTALLLWELWRNSALARARFGFNFLTSSNWDPVA